MAGKNIIEEGRKKQDDAWLNKFENTIPKSDDEYLNIAKIIKKEINEPEVLNIGIIAPYAAGKSSALKTWKELLSEEEKNKICSISVADFGTMFQSRVNKKSSLKGCNFDGEKELEKRVLQQIIYKDNSSKVIDSNYKKIDGHPWRNFIGSILLSFILMLALFITFQFFDNPFNVFYKIDEKYRFFIWIVAGIEIALIGILAYFLLKHNSIKGVKISAFEFEKNDNDDISPFNVYMDEIIYRFQKLEYNIVLIEDLDRFTNYNIFIKLRELCLILNNTDRIGWKISFVYAIKESLFKSPEERSKFFDAVIPIIPSYSKNNMHDIVLKEISAKFKTDELDSATLNALIPYIPNRRVLKNILNDYLIYSKELHNFNDLNQLFSLMVYKNIQPLDFEKTQNGGDSLVIRAFKEKNELIQEKINQNNEAIAQKREEIKKKQEELNKTQYSDIGVLKKLLFASIKAYKGNNVIGWDDSFDAFEKLNQITIFTNDYYGRRQQETIPLSEIEKNYIGELGFFAKHEIKQKTFVSDQIRNLENEISELFDKNRKLRNKSFKELYIEYSKKYNTLEGDKNAFYRLLLGSSLINEDYYKCLSKSSSTYLTAEDNSIVNLINSRCSIEFEKIIPHPKEVVNMIFPERFAEDYAFNFSLVSELLNGKNSVLELSLNYFKEFLKSEHNYICTTVLHSNLDLTNKVTFLRRLCKQNIKIWNDLLIIMGKETSDLYNERLLCEFLYGFEKEFTSLNEDGSVSTFLASSDQFKLDKLSTNLIKELERQHPFVFKNIKTMENKEILKYIASNSLFLLNFENINVILANLFSKDYGEIAAKNYMLISECDNDGLKAYVENNINVYLNAIYKDDKNFLLDKKYINELLLNKEIDFENKKKIIDKEFNSADYTSKYSSDVVDYLFLKGKVDVNDSKDYELLVESSISKESLKNYILERKVLEELGTSLNYSSFHKLKLFVLNDFELISKCSNLKNLDYCRDDFLSIKSEECREEYIRIFRFEFMIDFKKGEYDFSSYLSTLINSKILRKNSIATLINDFSIELFSLIIKNNIENKVLLSYLSELNLSEEKKAILPGKNS